MTVLNKNELLQLSRGLHAVVRQFESEDDLANFVYSQPGLPYIHDQYYVTLIDVDKAERVWDETLPLWLERYGERKNPGAHERIERGSLVYYKDKEKGILRQAIVTKMPSHENAYSSMHVFTDELTETLMAPKLLTLFREQDFEWFVMDSGKDATYKRTGPFRTQVGVYMRLLDGVVKPASVQWRHKRGDLIRQEPVDKWVAFYNAFNTKMQEIEMGDTAEEARPWKVTNIRTQQEYTFANREQVADFLYTRSTKTSYVVSVVLGSAATAAVSQTIRGDLWLAQYNEQQANQRQEEMKTEPYTPYMVKSHSYTPKLDEKTGKHAGFVSLETRFRMRFRTRDEVRAYLESAQYPDKFSVHTYALDGTVIDVRDGHLWLAQYFPAAVEKQPTLEEEIRAIRIGMQEFVEEFQRLTASIREAIEIFRPPIVYAFPDRREGDVIETQEGPVTWKEGETGLDYHNWVATQHWPDGATHATMDRHGGCCWWKGSPTIAPKTDLGWQGQLVERFCDPAVPFYGVDWKLSLVVKPEEVDGQEA